MHNPGLSAQQNQSNTHPTTAATLNNTKTAQATSAGEFIYYSTMLPQSTAEATGSTGKNNDSARMMSVDLKLHSDDLELAPNGEYSAQLSDAKPMPITSSGFVAQNFLAEQAKQEPVKFEPLPRPSKMVRGTTGDSILKGGLDLHDGRISSSDWKMEEFRDESSLAMKQLEGKQGPCVGSLCFGMQRMSTDDGIDFERTAAVRMASDMSSDWVSDFPAEQNSLGPVRPSLFDEKENSDRKLLGVPTQQVAASSMKPSTKNSASTTAKVSTKKKKKKQKRIIDLGHPCDPTDDDILFGRGGFTNSHPGNIRFREEALRLRPLYERSSKEEKYTISQQLLEAVTCEGARFLEKGKDGNWYQVIGNGARKKASQALRERMKGTPRRKGAAKRNLAGSLTSVQSANSQSSDPAEASFAPEINGDVYAI